MTTLHIREIPTDGAPPICAGRSISDVTFAPHASISTIALGTSAPACCQVAGVTTGLQNWMKTATALPVAAMSVKNCLINMAH